MTVVIQVMALSVLALALGRVARLSRSALAVCWSVALAGVLVYDTAVVGAVPFGLSQVPPWYWVPLASIAGAGIFGIELEVRALTTHRALVADLPWLFGGRPAAAMLVLASVISVMEELLFRGLLAAWATPTITFVAFSAGAFGLAHSAFGWADMVAKTVLGAMCGLALLWSGSLLPALVLHLTYNWFALIGRGSRMVMA